MKQRAAVFLATTFLSGYFPVAPGTVGSFFAIVVLWLVAPVSWILLTVLSIIFFLAGVWAAAQSDRYWETKDSGRINWDECVGMVVSMIYLPKIWVLFLAAFFLFRFFDILKPFPVRQAESFPGGWGVMLDDVLAGIYTNLVLQIGFRYIFPLLSG